MKLLILVLVIVLSKAVFLLSLMEVTKRNEASSNRITALNEVVTRLNSKAPLTETDMHQLQEAVTKHRLGPQIIPYNLSVASYMLIIPTSFWIFITSIRTAFRQVRKNRRITGGARGPHA